MIPTPTRNTHEILSTRGFYHSTYSTPERNSRTLETSCRRRIVGLAEDPNDANPVLGSEFCWVVRQINNVDDGTEKLTSIGLFTRAELALSHKLVIVRVLFLRFFRENFQRVHGGAFVYVDVVLFGDFAS